MRSRNRSCIFDTNFVGIGWQISEFWVRLACFETLQNQPFTCTQLSLANMTFEQMNGSYSQYFKMCLSSFVCLDLCNFSPVFYNFGISGTCVCFFLCTLVCIWVNHFWNYPDFYKWRGTFWMSLHQQLPIVSGRKDIVWSLLRQVAGHSTTRTQCKDWQFVQFLWSLSCKLDNPLYSTICWLSAETVSYNIFFHLTTSGEIFWKYIWNLGFCGV